ncbi:MAG: UbiA family prenyltransferase [Bacteroidota bacterium]
MKLLKGLRLPNLAIVALNQYLLLWAILVPYYQFFKVKPQLTPLQFALLVLSTMLVTGAGNIVNDIYDQAVDRINKPHKVWFQESDVPKVWRVYWIMNAIGWGIAWYVAIDIDSWFLNFLYPLAAGLLFWYSADLKGRSWYGNLLIAFFCGMVNLIVLYGQGYAGADFKLDFPTSNFIEPGLLGLVYNGPFPDYLAIQFAFISYSIFAFITTLIRELVKDLEDRAGDASQGMQTYPVKFGFFRAKWLLRKQYRALLGLLTLFILILLFSGYIVGVLLAIGLLFLPALWIYRQVEQAATTADFAKLSQMMKFFMLSGLLYLPIFSFIYFPIVIYET